MTRKIFRSVFLAALAILIAGLALVIGILYRSFTTVEKNQLLAQLTLASQGVTGEGLSYFHGLEHTECRLTWVAADGSVLYDSEVDPATMENHSKREEIREALKTGVGESERTSSTLSKKTIYRAQKLVDGSVMRVSTTQDTIISLLVGIFPSLFCILLLAILLSFLLARRLSHRIVAPLEAINLDQPLENDTYEELSPLLTRLEQQHRQIDGQLEALQRRQDEFATITGSMDEGLVLLNEQGSILSINPAAAALFGTTTDCVGNDMLTIDRSLATQALIHTAQGGETTEATLSLHGGEYQLHASPVLSGGTVAGIALLSFNVTEKMAAERQRREFSANVSHELKTPLQSILGSAELLENGLVKPADISRFAGHIRAEAGRLVMLINDIIRLSQLDEGNQLPREEVNLSALAHDAVQTLATAAAQRDITLQITGASVTLTGVRRLLWEIVYNLCDNAIKYNRDHGSVTVDIRQDEKNAILTISDTGIGIPPDQQARVFERFYRVDKSHSKETGGTGLGLSIVKHAAQYHNAVITMDSTPDQGTTICVRFPLVSQALS